MSPVLRAHGPRWSATIRTVYLHQLTRARTEEETVHLDSSTSDRGPSRTAGTQGETPR